MRLSSRDNPPLVKRNAPFSQRCDTLIGHKLLRAAIVFFGFLLDCSGIVRRTPITPDPRSHHLTEDLLSCLRCGYVRRDVSSWCRYDDGSTYLCIDSILCLFSSDEFFSRYLCLVVFVCYLDSRLIGMLAPCFAS